jgi:hypothetical protein
MVQERFRSQSKAAHRSTWPTLYVPVTTGVQ